MRLETVSGLDIPASIGTPLCLQVLDLRIRPSHGVSVVVAMVLPIDLRSYSQNLFHADGQQGSSRPRSPTLYGAHSPHRSDRTR